MGLPVVAVVGRPNVGKSALFNRILGQRLAVVEAEPGVTRDRLYGRVEWNGRGFLLVDTGGIEEAGQDQLRRAVQEQVYQAIHDADVLLLVMDSREGITPADADAAQIARESGKPVVLAINKVDTPGKEDDSWEFFGLGFTNLFAVSAEHGHNTGDLLDQVVELLPAVEAVEEGPEGIRVAVVGRPNVGKSSLVNSLLGYQRQVVSDKPSTTRDAVDSLLETDGERYLLVDTAGLRRRSRVETGVEQYSTLRALKAVERCDVALLVLDAANGIADQDRRIGGYIEEAGKGIVLVYNKWDLVEKDHRTYRQFEKDLRAELHFLHFAPLVFISALTGQRVQRLLPLVRQVQDNRCRQLPTSELNRIIEEAVDWRPPPSTKGRAGRIYYATQAGTEPPRFLVFVNNPQLFPASYLRYLENQLRNADDFSGTPLRVQLRRRK